MKQILNCILFCHHFVLFPIFPVSIISHMDFPFLTLVERKMERICYSNIIYNSLYALKYTCPLLQKAFLNDS